MPTSRDGFDSEIGEVFQRVTDGIFALDRDWEFTYVNERAQELIGRDAEALVGTNVWDAFPDAVESRFYDEYHEAMETQEPVTFDAAFEPLDAHFEVRAFPSESGLSVYFRDIKQQQQREQQLEEYRATLDAIGDGAYAVDADREFVFVNDVFLELTGYEREALLGRPTADLLAPADREAVSGQIEQLLAGERDVGVVETEIGTADGDTFWAEARFRLRPGPDAFNGTVGIIRDVTDRRRRKEQLETHRDKLAALVDRTEVVQDINRVMADAATREAVERTVCEKLTASPFYDIAWIGDEIDGRIACHAGAGVEDDTLDRIAEATGTTGNVESALRRETVQVTQNIVGERGRTAVLEELGYAATVSLPLVHDEQSFGVLTVTSTEPHAFGGTERELLSNLAHTVAYVLHAVEERERHRSVVTDVLESAIDAGVVIVDDEDQVRYCNEQAGRFLGFDPEAPVGYSNQEFVERWLRPAVEDPTDVAVRQPTEPEIVGGIDELHLVDSGEDHDRYVERRRSPIDAGLYAGGYVELFYDITARKRSEQALSESERLQRTLLSNLPGMAYQCQTEPGWPMEFVSDGCRALAGYDPAALERGEVSWAADVVLEADYDDLTAAIDAALSTGDPFETTYRIQTADDEVRWVWERGRLVETTQGDQRLEGFISDITEQRTQQQDLERLNHVNAVIRRINRELVRASDRGTVRETVCAQLAGTDDYCAAWFAEVDLAADELRAVAGSGIDLSGVEPTSASDEETVVSQAIRDGAVTVGEVGSPAQREMVSRTDCADEDAAIAAIPVSYANTEYGALCLCANDESVFSAEICEVFEELGETIGHALNAHLRKEGLVSDTATKLEFRLRGFPPGDFELSQETEQGDTAVEFERTVMLPDGNVLQYVTTSGISRASFEELVDAVGTVERIQELSTGDDDPIARYEIEQSEPPMVKQLATHGGKVDSVTIKNGDLYVVAELPDGTDVREVVEKVFEAYPAADLEAQRSVKRSDTGSVQLRDDLRASLTDRQRNTLEVAYFAGYFEWPRETNGEGVADALNVSQSTFSQHLRAGERKTFEFLFDSTE